MTSYDTVQRVNPLVIDIYARLSKAVNGQTITVDDQIEMGTKAITARGARVGRVFKDNSKSAWNPKVVRKDWEALMTRLESGESDGVWVLDVTRFSRKMMEGERLIKVAERGIAVWSRSVQYDLMTADGRKHFREAMVTAASESDKISERTRDGKQRRANKGRHMGGTRGYGMPGWFPVGPDWERGDPRDPIPAEQIAFERAMIRECYDRIFAGERLTDLVWDFDRRGILSPQGRRWTTTPLGNMLRRPAVAGLLNFRGEVAGKLATIEPIVSREEWERMCAIFDGRKRGRPLTPIHKLSAVLWCGTCGHKLYGFTRPRLDENGGTWREYRCHRTASMPDSCGHNVIDALYAEEIIKDAVIRRLGDPRRAERVAWYLAHARDEREKLREQKAVLEQAADGLSQKVATWGLERVENAMGPILKEITKIDQKLATIQDTETLETATRDAASTWNEAVERTDMPALREMVHRAFPRLTIRPPERPHDNRPERFDWEGETRPHPA
jgi:DNA invertase Pin-like site-specific DNA recombinase